MLQPLAPGYDAIAILTYATHNCTAPQLHNWARRGRIIRYGRFAPAQVLDRERDVMHPYTHLYILYTLYPDCTDILYF